MSIQNNSEDDRKVNKCKGSHGPNLQSYEDASASNLLWLYPHPKPAFCSHWGLTLPLILVGSQLYLNMDPFLSPLLL